MADDDLSIPVLLLKDNNSGITSSQRHHPSTTKKNPQFVIWFRWSESTIMSVTQSLDFCTTPTQPKRQPYPNLILTLTFCWVWVVMAPFSWLLSLKSWELAIYSKISITILMLLVVVALSQPNQMSPLTLPKPHLKLLYSCT